MTTQIADPADTKPPSGVARPPETRPEDRLSLVEKMAFAAGYVPHQTGWYALKNWSKLIGPIVYGINPGIMAMVLGLMRVWDAFTDPIMGRISDNSRLKMGRRRPFIIIGAILCGIIFPFLWLMSPDWSETAKWVYFLCVAVVYYTAYTIFSVPYLALKYELTPDYQERTRIAVVAAYAGKAFSIFVPWYFPITQSGIFGEPVTATRIVAVAFGVVIAVMGVIAGMIPRERYRKVAAKQEKVSIWKSLTTFATDSTFWKLKGIMIGVQLNALLVDLVVTYLGIYYVWQGAVLKGATIQAIATNSAMILGIATIAIVSRWFAHVDKLILIKLGLGAAVLGVCTKWFMLNPEYPYLSLLVAVYMAPATSAFWLTYSALKPDYLDYDEYRHGKRREGVFSAATGWLLKASMSLGTMIAGGILVFSGFKISEGADQADGVFFTMRVIMVVIPVVNLGIAYLCAKSYPLTAIRMAEIRGELENRRGRL